MQCVPVCVCLPLAESSVLSSTCFPHVVPLLSLLERGVAVGEGLEPWESSDCGVDVVMSHLEAARSIAHHGGLYRTNAESKLQGICYIHKAIYISVNAPGLTLIMC